jgi:hypothetical protein
MTSRTTPVGILVVALASLFALGCTAQTSAVFEALAEPARAPASSSEADPADAAENGASTTWWPHEDGYRMELPPGWFGVEVDSARGNRVRSRQLLDAAASSHPGLVGRMRSVLGDSGSRLSAIAGDTSAGASAPVMVVLAQDMNGMRPYEIKQHVKKQIGQLPGLAATPFLQDAGLSVPRGGWRFDYSLDDPDLGDVRVRSYLIPFDEMAYVVNFVASQDAGDDVETLFDDIVDSLRFGI